MNKVIMVGVAAFMLVAAGAGGSQAGVGFRAIGGFTHISYSDYNEWADDVNESLAGVADVANIRWVPEFGAEFYYTFSPMIEAGLGVGIISGSSDIAVSDLTGTLSLEHGMKAYPLSANLYFRPAVPFVSMKPYVYGGVAMVYSSVDFSLRIPEAGETEGYDADLNAWGLGLHGGGGIEFSIAPKVSLDLGFRLRWADIDGFEGTATSLDGETKDVFLAGEDSGDGFLYGAEDVAEKGNYDEGSVDLSGYSLYIGIKAGF
ncbi:MAG TPA: outer membrane beta-barrel protein [Candidatus Krumholzibacterium sp.]|nr:outer membrane beta-barrel protein [Candidatus Krumholzibacterium sp.]